MKWRELSISIFALLSVLFGVVPFLRGAAATPEQVKARIAFAVVGLICGIVALTLHATRPK